MDTLSGMLCCVIGQVVPCISKAHGGFICFGYAVLEEQWGGHNANIFVLHPVWTKTNQTLMVNYYIMYRI